MKKYFFLIILFLTMFDLLGTGSLILYGSPLKNEQFPIDLRVEHEPNIITGPFKLSFFLTNISQRSYAVFCKGFVYEFNNLILMDANENELRPLYKAEIRHRRLNEKDFTILKPKESCFFELEGTLKRDKAMKEDGKIVRGLMLSFNNSAFYIGDLSKKKEYWWIGIWFNPKNRLFSEGSELNSLIYEGILKSQKIPFRIK